MKTTRLLAIALSAATAFAAAPRSPIRRTTPAATGRRRTQAARTTAMRRRRAGRRKPGDVASACRGPKWTAATG